MKGNELKELLNKWLSSDEMILVPKSFDLVGSREKAVAIIEPSEILKSHKDLIIKALLQVHKNVKSILIKESERNGIYRLRKYTLLFGEDNTEVVHKEHGCSFKLDPRKVYFSPREGTERLRIAERVRPDEVVLVMFSGVGPFPILIARMQPKVKKIFAVELNPVAHNYCMKNIQLNKAKDKVYPVLGDVSKVCPKLGEKFDRVIMPLPKGAYKFLDVAVPCLKDDGILHFYHWAPEMDLFSEAKDLVLNAAKKFGKETNLLSREKVLPYGPRMWKVRIDVRIS